jgi:hypothetical protein
MSKFVPAERKDSLVKELRMIKSQQSHQPKTQHKNTSIMPGARNLNQIDDTTSETSFET